MSLSRVGPVPESNFLFFHPISYRWYGDICYSQAVSIVNKKKNISQNRQQKWRKRHISPRIRGDAVFVAKISAFLWYCVTVASCPFSRAHPTTSYGQKIRGSVEWEVGGPSSFFSFFRQRDDYAFVSGVVLKRRLISPGRIISLWARHLSSGNTGAILSRILNKYRFRINHESAIEMCLRNKTV